MVAPLVVAGGILAASAIGGIMGGKSAKKSRKMAEATLAHAKEMAEKAGLVFDELDTPTQEQIIGDVVKYLETVPEEQAVQILGSKMEMLETDSELAGSQRMALARLTEMGEKGLTPEEEMEREMLMNEISGAEQARQKGIVQSMQERGTEASGIEAALRAQSSQSAANRARQEGLALAAQRDRRALEGIQAQASLAGQIRGQEFQEGAAKASAADQIAQFNAAQRAAVQARNVQNLRDIAQQKTQAREKAYGYELGEAQGKAQAYTNQAQMLGQHAGTQAQAAAQKSQAAMKLFGEGIKGAGTAMSDVRAKENIKPGKEKIEDMLSNLDAYEYDYKEPEKHGEGKQLGIMAQDLEKSDLGKEFVVDMPEEQSSDYVGDEPAKGIDYGSMAPTIVAAQAEMQKETKDLKDRVQQLESLLNTFRTRRDR